MNVLSACARGPRRAVAGSARSWGGAPCARWRRRLRRSTSRASCGDAGSTAPRSTASARSPRRRLAARPAPGRRRSGAPRPSGAHREHRAWCSDASGRISCSTSRWRVVGHLHHLDQPGAHDVGQLAERADAVVGGPSRPMAAGLALLGHRRQVLVPGHEVVDLVDVDLAAGTTSSWRRSSPSSARSTLVAIIRPAAARQRVPSTALASRRSARCRPGAAASSIVVMHRVGVRGARARGPDLRRAQRRLRRRGC